MPRGQPDFGLYTETPVASGISDPGEAAARLGSINIYDRRGWTVWFDDFEAPSLKWHTGATAPGEVAVLSTATSFSGIQSLFLNVPAGMLAESYIDRIFPLIRRGKVGFEFWVQGQTKALGYFQLRINIYDGVAPYQVVLLYDTTAEILYIVTPAGNIPIATNVMMLTSSFYFLPIKLVVDIDTDLYTRLLVGEREFDISTHAQVALPASTDRYIQVYFYVVGEATIDKWMYLDNFILTQNEP